MPLPWLHALPWTCASCSAVPDAPDGGSETVRYFFSDPRFLLLQKMQNQPNPVCCKLYILYIVMGERVVSGQRGESEREMRMGG